MIQNAIGIIIIITLVCYAFSVGCAIGILRNSKIWTSFIKATDIPKNHSKYAELKGACVVFAPVFLIFFVLLSVGVLGYKITKLFTYKKKDDTSITT